MLPGARSRGKGQIDSLAIYSVPLKDEVPPLPNPAQFATDPIFVNPTTVLMQAVPGVDPLGGVEYLFEESSGHPGGDDSGWLKTPAYQDTGLEQGKAFWMRSWGPHPNGDSIYYGLDMQSNDRSLFHTGNGKLQWQRHRDWTFEVDKPGLHAVNVWMREDGAAFDRLIITSDQSMGIGDAASEGPAESDRAPATASK